MNVEIDMPILTLTALLSTGGCSLTDSAAPEEQLLDGTEWTLTAIETADATIDGTVLENPAWVGFDMNAPEEEYQLYGFNGCNQFGGTYRQIGSQLTVSVLWNTDAPCPGSIEPVAVTFMMGLDNALQFSVSGGVLRIQCSGDTALNLYVRTDP